MIVSFAVMNLYVYIYIKKKGSHDFIQNLQNYFSLDVKILFLKFSMIIYNLYQYLVVSFAVMNISNKRFT